MSCDINKGAAVSDWGHQDYASAPSPIQMYEETKSDQNECDVSNTKGTVNASLIFVGGILNRYVKGTGKMYLKITKQIDGFSDSGTNDPPVISHTPATYEQDSLQRIVLGQNFISSYYADFAPTVSDSNNCDSDTKLGWMMTDAQVVMNRTVLQSAYAKFS